MAKANITFDVRQVSRGFWTYDLYFHDDGCRSEYSIGECFSRREAEKSARRAIRDRQKEGEPTEFPTCPYCGRGKRGWRRLHESAHCADCDRHGIEPTE